MKFDRAQWQSATSRERRAWSDEIAAQLPEGWYIDGYLPGHGAGQFVSPDYAEFRIVPGGPATLGFDAARWSPPPEVAAYWAALRARKPDSIASRDVREWLAERTSRPREVLIPTMLVESRAREIGWDPLADDDPQLDRVLAELGPTAARGQVAQSWRGGRQFRVRPSDEPGRVFAESRTAWSHADWSARCAAEGMRLLTPDEWEYACGAGNGALFRWGNSCYLECYPDDFTDDLYRRVDEGSEALPPSWDEATRVLALNVFELEIAGNSTWRAEVVSDPKLRLGGDGGVRVCGGAEVLDAWVVLASAFRDPSVHWDAQVDGGWCRRARTIESL